VHVLQGERELAQGNKSLGKFDLTDIPPAQRGVPQIEVAFDIDANGILNVSAKDKATGKEQSIVIKASSGLSDDEIDKMVRDAELHADEDRKLREMVELRNQAENLIHGTEKSLETLGEQASDAEKADVKSKIDALRGSLDGDDKEAVTAAMEALSASASELAQRAYAASAGGAEGAEGVGRFG